jgi:CHRD domain
MRKLVTLLAAGAVAVLVLTTLSLGAVQKTIWTAALSSRQEVPKQAVRNTAAHGLFKGTLVGHKLHWKLTFAKLTGPAMAAHIHKAARGKAGPVVVVLCPSAPCKSGMTGTATINSALMKAFAKHLLYVNVHTAKNQNGEIRGQLARG